MWLSPGSCAATFPGAACKINKVRGWRGVPAISRQNVHKLTHCLSLIWRIIPLPPSTHFCQYLHPLQNGIVIQCFRELLQQQFQEQLVRSTVKSKMESWYIFCKWKVQSNRSRVFMSHSLIIFVICIPISTFQTRLALS